MFGIPIKDNYNRELPLKSDKKQERKCEECQMLELCKRFENPNLKIKK